MFAIGVYEGVDKEYQDTIMDYGYFDESVS